MTVGAGLALGGGCVGETVRGIGVAEDDGDALCDGDGDGLADGAAICCEEFTAAPSKSRATSATAAKTVNTVDHRSTGRRTGAGRAG